MTSCYLFSYGTLRRPEVQEAVFGRTLPAYPDSVLDHRVSTVRITDPAVIATSGSVVHPVLEPAPGAHVDGDALAITEADLPAADAYEVDDYVRAQIVLASGRTAWAYLASTVGRTRGERRGTSSGRWRGDSTGGRRTSTVPGRPYW